MPAFNEEEAIEEAVREVERHVLSAVAGSDLTVVNDGSRDQTGKILDQLAEGNPRIRVIHQTNSGHGPALRTGLEAAHGEWLFLIDSDRQIPLEAFGQLREAAQGRDGAFGVRAERHDPRVRIVLSRLIRAALRLLFGVPLRDANVPFKLLRRDVWLTARRVIPEGTLAPSLFLAVVMRRWGLDVAEIEVPHRRRATGTASIRRWRLLKFCARALCQLVALRWRIRGAAKPPPEN